MSAAQNNNLGQSMRNNTPLPQINDEFAFSSIIEVGEGMSWFFIWICPRLKAQFQVNMIFMADFYLFIVQAEIGSQIESLISL